MTVEISQNERGRDSFVIIEDNLEAEEREIWRE